MSMKPIGRRNGPSRLSMALCLVVICTVNATMSGTVQAQSQPAQERIIYTRQSEFSIPFEMDPADRPIREVRLYVSDDQGRTWRKYSTAVPEDKGFKFRTERDGMFWFTVQTSDVDGKVKPPVVQGARPQLRIATSPR